MKCFGSCLYNHINSRGETFLRFYFQSVCRPWRTQNIALKHFTCSSKRNLLQRNPISASAHRFIMSERKRWGERERKTTVEYSSNFLSGSGLRSQVTLPVRYLEYWRIIPTLCSTSNPLSTAKPTTVHYNRSYSLSVPIAESSSIRNPKGDES